MQHAELTKPIIGAAFDAWNELGFGFLESVYEKSLLIALTEQGLPARSQVGIPVRFRGQLVGEYVADIVVNDLIILELKSVNQLAVAHEVQLVNYLTATGHDIGLLINFGPNGVDVKRKHRTPATNQS
ncbi:MAG: GxxExxY protein [Planctomycetota bacterium]